MICEIEGWRISDLRRGLTWTSGIGSNGDGLLEENRETPLLGRKSLESRETRKVFSLVSEGVGERTIARVVDVRWFDGDCWVRWVPEIWKVVPTCFRQAGMELAMEKRFGEGEVGIWS